MNGPLHLGHAFTGTRVDVYARYKRMQGYNVLFPWAWHWTGQPIVAAADRLARGDPAMLHEFRDMDGVPESEIKRFIDPKYMAQYYTDQGREALRLLGFSIDWRREFHTTELEPRFSRFVEWQYARLREGGYVVQGTHPVVWCPRDQSPTGDHDRLEGEGVSWEEYTLMKFRCDDFVLPAATLRPETIYGVTNLWLHPDGLYAEARVNGERWIVSKEAVAKLREQSRSIVVEREVQGAALIGKWCVEPIQRRRVPILPGAFVSTGVGSGVVYSVPAHAPLDYVALRDLLGDPAAIDRFKLARSDLEALQPISVIRTEGFGDFPAVDVVEQLHVQDQRDPKCEEATQLLYKREFHTGMMRENTGPFAGARVADVKSRLLAEFRSQGAVEAMYDLPAPVICRCTTSCIVKVLRDQWFLRYSDPNWKMRTLDLLNRAEVHPNTARQWFVDVINWYREWPCARRVGLGTPLPWSPGWIVETLSDSTLYMAFYTVAHLLRQRGVPPEALTPEVFDFVYHGKGTAHALTRATGLDQGLLEAMRSEFTYWYPVDLRNSAKELLPNHLTFFLFHHAALFPTEQWPRVLGVNGMMMSEGVKMSKSKGNTIPVRRALEEFGADVVRATLMASAEELDDADWRAQSAKDFARKLVALHTFITDLTGAAAERPSEQPDRWLLSVLQRRIDEVAADLDGLRTRSAFQTAFFDLWNDLRWYLRRVERPQKAAVSALLDAWVRILSPFIPYFAEERFAELGKRGFAAQAAWPVRTADRVDEEAELGEFLITRLLEDARSVLNLVPATQGRLHVYVAERWKAELLRQLGEARRANRPAREVLTTFQASGDRTSAKEEVGKVAERLIRLLNDLGDGVVTPIIATGVPDEATLYRGAQTFFERELKVRLTVHLLGSTELYDPRRRAPQALPTKPALFVE
jgi:leucyl-tRNA synthetase